MQSENRWLTWRTSCVSVRTGTAGTQENGCAAALLQSVNIRYATDSRNQTVWMLHNQGRYCSSRPWQSGVRIRQQQLPDCTPPLPAIAEYRPARIHAFFDVAEHADEVSRLWAAEIADVVSTLMGRRRNAWRSIAAIYWAMGRWSAKALPGGRAADLELARQSMCGRDRVRASLAGGRGYRHGADAQDTAAGDHRESAVGRIALREYRERR